MSRIGRKPIAIPQGVKVSIEGNLVKVQGPKGVLETRVPQGITVAQQDGHLVAQRETDHQSALHGLTRALINNAVEGVTKGWNRDLEIVGIGYRAELKTKNVVVFTLGYSHPIEYPLPDGIAVACGYLLKRCTPEELISAIREVRQGGAPMSREIARKVILSFQEPVTAAAEVEGLSPREREILELLAEGFPNKQIAARVGLTDGTVRWHLRHVYHKLHVRSRTEAALKFLSGKAE